MSPAERYESFIFESCGFDSSTGTVTFAYSFDGERMFTEKLYVDVPGNYDEVVFARVLRFAWLVAGISYYKCFPAKKMTIRNGEFSHTEASFLNETYRHGLSQFIFENHLTPEVIATFDGTHESAAAVSYEGNGTLVLQSGGKDSLLLATILHGKHVTFTPWYMTNIDSHPKVLDTFEKPLRTIKRQLDIGALSAAATDGGLNGHVPVTFITLAYALLDGVLHGENTVLAAIGREGEEPHAYIEDYAVTHQWSKTWPAEQLFADFVSTTISADLRVGSPLRAYSELKIAELFTSRAWEKYGHAFSSCNLANYKQGHDNEELTWCGDCPKCANSFLLFAPFVRTSELESLFHGNLFEKESLKDTFKGLLGVDGFMKPFECVGEIDELRYAYHLAQENGYKALPFDVPHSSFDKDATTACQPWAQAMIQ